MFNKMIRIFHDGMIIIEQDNVMFKNDQIYKIFNLQKEEFNDTNNVSQGTFSTRTNLVEAMLNTTPKTSLN